MRTNKAITIPRRGSPYSNLSSPLSFFKPYQTNSRGFAEISRIRLWLAVGRANRYLNSAEGLKTSHPPSLSAVARNWLISLRMIWTFPGTRCSCIIWPCQPTTWPMDARGWPKIIASQPDLSVRPSHSSRTLLVVNWSRLIENKTNVKTKRTCSLGIIYCGWVGSATSFRAGELPV